MSKPILCLDFDGVLNGYQSGWQGADICPDPAVPGSIEFLDAAVQDFTVAIYSSRSGQANGIEAMQFWLKCQCYKVMEQPAADELLAKITWPTEKPPAMVTIDDRALCFTGNWVDFPISDLLAFQPWNKRKAPSCATIPNPDALRDVVEALEFYANGIGHTEIEDGGAIASAALAKLGEV